ncbi:MAG: murein biosynthesis integral membrane protein MurJ [Planctomycetaceae bacterium]
MSVPSTETPVSPASTANDPPAGLFAGLRIVGSWTLASRILGLARDMAMAALFGNGAVLDAFTVAFRIPNLARRLFGEGALAAAFLPAFTRELETNGRRAAWRLGTAMLVALVWFLAAVVLVAELLLGAAWLAGGSTGESALLIGLTALLLPYLVLICASALVGSILHALGHFTWPALLPVMLNVAWLLGLWGVWRAPLSDAGKMHVIAVVIVLSGIVQFAAPLPALRRAGFRFDRTWRSARDQVRDVARGMFPVLLGLSITQLNTLADSLIAWGFAAPESAQAADVAVGPIAAGTASALYFGQRMYQFPLGIFGVALGTVMFPLLARHAGRNRFDHLREDLTLGMRLVVFVGLPASIGLMLLAEPLTSLFFERGRFGPDDVRQTSAMIAAYGAAVWAYSGLLIAQRGFYAVGDRLTPLRAGMVAVAVNLVLDFTLIWVMGGMGLAVATSIAAAVQLALTLWLMRARIGELHWRPLRSTTLRTLLACAAMTAATLAALAFVDHAGMADGSAMTKLLRVAAPLCAGIAAYFLAARLLRMEEPRLLLSGRKKTP